MPSLIQSSFSGGEWAPEYAGRTDLPGYKEALALARNMVILPQGGATSRPGFRHVAFAKHPTPANPVRLERFAAAAGVRYMLEFGPGYIRFFRQRAPVLSGGLPLEVATPYSGDDLAGLSLTRLPGQIFIWHALHPPQLLFWSSPDSFGIAAAVFNDGPYLDPVPGGTTITPAAASASTTLTASATTGINGGAGFRSDDVGRLARFRQATLGLSFAGGSVANAGSNYHVGDTWIAAGGVFIRPAILTVTAITGGGVVAGLAITDPGQYLVAPANPVAQASSSGSGTSLSLNLTWPQALAPVWIYGTIGAWHSTVSVDVAIGNMVLDAEGTVLAGQFISTAPINDWRLGAWCPYEGYPMRGGALFQQRLLAGATARAPKRVWASATADHGLMAPSLATGQVIDTNALVFDLDDDQAEPIAWIDQAGNVQQPELGIGSGDAEFVMQPGSAGSALSQTNIQAYRETKYTSAPIAPLRIGKSLLFVDGSGQRLRQWLYRWVAGGMIGPEPAPFGRHLLLAGLKQIDYALTPHQAVWGVTNDGQLVGLTYLADDPNGNVQIAAWHSHRLGGAWWGGPPLVESVAVVPSEDALPYDEVWVSVLRADPGGGQTRSIEVSTRPFRGLPLDQAVFADSAISSPLGYPNASCTPQPQGPFAPSGNLLLPKRGDTVGFAFDADVAVDGDLILGTVLRINGGTFRLVAVGDARAVSAECVDVPATLQPQPSGAWSYTGMATGFSGFDAHNGRVVQIIGDGALYPPQLVSGGTLRISPPASLVTAGYYALRELATLDLDLPSPDGTSQMKTGRLDHLYLRLFETAGGFYGPDAGRLDPIEARDAGDLLDWAPLAVSADFRCPLPGGSSEHRTIVVLQPDPWPLTVLALVVKGGTTEQAPR